MALPTARGLDWCRHCNEERVLTREHLPPRSSGNSEGFDVLDFYGNVTETATQHSEGYTVRHLCNDCQLNASRFKYVDEYNKLKSIVISAAEEAYRELEVDPLQSATGELNLELPYDFEPGRFARQAIGMILSTQTAPDVLSKYPALSNLLGCEVDTNKPSKPVELAPLRLYLALANGEDVGWRRPQIVLSSEGRLMVLTARFTPFAFFLSEGLPSEQMTEVTSWLYSTVREPSARLAKHERKLSLRSISSIRNPSLRRMFALDR